MEFRLTWGVLLGVGMEEIDLAEQEEEGAFFFKIFVGALIGYILGNFFDLVIVEALSILGVAVGFFRSAFHYSTIFAASLQPKSNRIFQVGISVLFPLLYSLLFFREGVPDWEVIVTNFNLFLLIVAGLIFYFSYGGGDILNKKFPFRGFIIVSTVIFLVLYLGMHGAFDGGSGDIEDLYRFDYDEQTQTIPKSFKVVQFFLYISASYSGLILKFTRKKSHKNRYLR